MDSSKLHIRKVRPSEVEALQQIAKTTFVEAFEHLNNPSDFETYVTKAFSVEQIAKELENSNSYFFFAILNKTIIGYLKLNKGPAQTDLQKENTIEIERIYVHATFQGKRIGQRLIDKAIAIARAEQFDSIWLGVWEKNPKAIRFYERLGFVTFDQHSFRMGTDIQTDLLMILDL